MNEMNGFQVTTDWLEARAAASPETIALIINDHRWSFRELDALASSLCGRLSAVGIRPGDHVAALLPNSLAAVVHTFATARLGAVLVPLNTRLTPAEVAWQVAHADCDHLVCATVTEELVAEVPEAIGRLVLPVEPTAFEAWATTCPQPTGRRATAAGFEATQALVFTSGTTGFPKGAMITYANHYWSTIASALRLGVRPEDRWLACLPLYHVGGLAVLFRSCLYGTAVVLHDGFDTGAIRRDLRDSAVTLVSLVPTMLDRLLHEGFTAVDAPALRLILLGGAAASPALLAQAHAAGLPVAVTYGLTEATSQVATRLPDEGVAQHGGAGRPLTFTAMRIIGGDGQDVPAGEPGEIVIAGPTVMAGYYRDESATTAALRDGWLHTGDIGYRDENDELWVLDRRDDLIVSGGENVYPAEIERTLRQHPAVSAACVVGLPDARWGQQVAAVVTLHQPDSVTEEVLIAHCRRHLAGYKCPRRVVFARELPQTASGKIRRRTVAEAMLSEGEPA